MPRVFVKIQREIAVFLFIFIGLSAAAFWMLNGGAYAEELRYYLFPQPIPSEPLFAFSASASDSSQTAQEAKTKTFSPGHAEPAMRIVIPKIRVDAPLNVPQTHATKDILASLEQGVGIYPESARFGQEGRAILLGHSSRASWYRGGYATIFALINKLEIGDVFYIIGNGKTHIYEVTTSATLTPSATNIMLAGVSDGSEVDLITCYPIGSASKRKVIRSRLLMTQTN